MNISKAGAVSSRRPGTRTAAILKIRPRVKFKVQSQTCRPVRGIAFGLILLLGWIAGSTTGVTAQPGSDELEFFENHIRPVLVDHCYECHSTTAKKMKGGLRVDSREALLKGGDTGPAVVPGDVAKSLLLRAVRHEDPDLAMPAKKPKLADSVISDLEKWIKQGALFPSGAVAAPEKPHWAFQPVRNPEVPGISRSVINNQYSVGARRRTDLLNTDSLITPSPIDAFILTQLPNRQLAQPAEKRTLLRRATYDLTGLPPSTEEVKAFEGDSSPDAFAKVVERLLASPHYGERWGRHWLDVAGYADSDGYSDADPPRAYAYKYRD